MLNYKAFWRLFLVGFGWLTLVGITLGQSQSIKFDGSLGQAGSNGANAAILTGPNYGILLDDGQTVGTNVFHSFEFFDLLTGEAVDLESTGMQNILVRVTDQSPLFGTGSYIAGSNLDGSITGWGESLFHESKWDCNLALMLNSI